MSGTDIVTREPGTDVIERPAAELEQFDPQQDRQPPPVLDPVLAAKDRAATAACEVVLRKEWGDEYDRRVALNQWALETELGEELADDLLFARMDNGLRVADVPAFSKALNDILCHALAAIEKQVEGAMSSDDSLEKRAAVIQEIMRTDFARYQKEFASEYSRILEELEKQGKITVDPWNEEEV